MALDRLTKITGPGIATDTNWVGNNANYTGIVTATKFVGPIEGAITSADASFTGNVTIGGTLTYEDVTNIDSVGLITARDGIFLPDDKHISLGTGNDMRIYSRAGGLNNSFIKKTGTGPLNFDFQGDFLIRNTNGTMRGKFTGPLGAVELHYSGQKKFETSAKGIQVGTGVTIETNGQASFTGIVTANGGIRIPNNTGQLDISTNSGGDAQINTAGVLNLATTSFRLRRASGSHYLMNADQGGGLYLYHNGSERLRTTATGIRVGTATTIETNGQATFVGVVTATSFFGDGSNLTGVSGFATALSNDQSSPLNVFFKTPKQVNISTGEYIVVQSDARSGNVAFCRESIIHVSTGATMRVATGTQLHTNVLDLF